MAKDLFFIPLGGGGGGDMSNYYTKQQIDAMLQGVQSIQGFQGTAGENGTQGIQGIKGSDGTNGVDGHQGIQGAVGASIQGLQGEQGETGASIQGSQGIQGATGASIQGIQGIRGDDGKNGNDGLQGIQGIQGSSGGSGVETVELTELTSEELGNLYEIVVNNTPVDPDTYLAEHRLVAYGMPVVSWSSGMFTIDENSELIQIEAGDYGAAFYTETNIVKEAATPDTITAYWYCIFKQGKDGNHTYVLEEGTNTYENSGGTPIQGIQGATGQTGAQGIQGIKGTDGTNGVNGLQGIQGIQGAAGSGGGGATRYDISTKSQAELAEFYQNWQTIMASNDVYFGVYPVVSVNPAYTQMDIGGMTVDVMLVEYNLQLGFVDDMPNIVSGKAGAWYILPNGMGGDYTAEMLFASKTYVDNGLQGKQDTLTAGTNISIVNNTISAGGGSVALSFTLADDSVVNYTVLTN